MIISVFIAFSNAQAQKCDCPYPIIFVHGWAGAETVWQDFANHLFLNDIVVKGGILIPTETDNEGTVYYAHLNYNYNSTNMRGENNIEDYPNYIDDDVIVHEQFFNAPDILPDRCVYAVSFNTKRTLVNGQLVYDGMSIWNDNNYIYSESGQSDSNESAAMKQGYALGKAIDKILQLTNKEKVILIGHSMGGIAIREYLQRSFDNGVTHPWWVNGHHRVAKVVTVGTPHLGSNFGQVFGSTLTPEIINLNINSEAVRDLRSSWTVSGEGYSFTWPGLYLFGNSDFYEYQIPENYHNQNVNCNWDPANDAVLGINESPAENPWEGTTYSLFMPLPNDIKYTYYVSDKLKDPLHLGRSDGIVLADKQWLYEEKNGTKIPSPILYHNNSYNEYFLSDRIITSSVAAHTYHTAFYTPFNPWNIGKITNETKDFFELIRTLDEPDFPYFAYKISKGEWYSGMTQKRADIVADDSNADMGKGSSDRTTDSDWYKIDLDLSLDNPKLLMIRNNFVTDTRIDIFPGNIDLFINDHGAALNSLLLAKDTEKVGVMDLSNLSQGTYYIRITQSMNSENTHHRYKFAIVDNSNITSIDTRPRYEESIKNIPVLKVGYEYYLADISRNIYLFDMDNTSSFDRAELYYDYNWGSFWKNEQISEIQTDAYWDVQKAHDMLQTTITEMDIDLQSADKIELFTNLNIPEIYGLKGSNAFTHYGTRSIMTGSGDPEMEVLPMASLDIVGGRYFRMVLDHNNKLIKRFSNFYEKGVECKPEYFQTQAIAEAYCDIFGLYLEHKHGDNKLVSRKAYITGFDVKKRRNFREPKVSSADALIYYDPAIFNSPNCNLSPQSAAFIMSHWFYLLSEGGKDINAPRPYDITGIGIDNAFMIVMKTLDSHVGEQANFEDFCNATMLMAKFLFGDCSQEFISVQNAWYAVGVHSISTLMINDIVFEKPDCGEENGSIEVIIDGSIAGLQYLWDTGATGNKIEDIAAGTYSVEISSSEGCSITREIELEEELSFKFKINITQNSDCNSPNGSASLIIRDKNTNSVPASLSIEWKDNNGNFLGNGMIVNNLIPGDYIVLITDLTTTCSTEEVFKIDQSLPGIGITGGGFLDICTDYIPPHIVLNVGASNCNNCQVVSWFTDGGSFLNISDDQLTVEVPVQNADYSVELIDAGGCIYTYSTHISIKRVDCSKCAEDALSFINFTGVDPCRVFTMLVLRPVDPNEIIGPIGYEEQRWLSRKDPLPYTILFENDPQFADAQASRVEINCSLDDNMNPASFRIGNFGFANIRIEVDENRSHFQSRIDLRDSLGVFVDVVAGLDIVDNKAFWIFQAIDPVTGLPPDDPNLGLLPVNDTISRRGEGLVEFLIRPFNSTVTGDIIFATAEIVFDNNEGIITNTEFNTIDVLPPVSVMNGTPSHIDSTIVLLNWSAIDDPGGCGVKDYMLYVSENGGPLFLFASGIIDTFFLFQGRLENTYCFQVRARDWVGNTEEKSDPDVCLILSRKVEIFPVVFLQGPYIENDTLMHDILRTEGLIPIVSPYTDTDIYYFGDIETAMNPQALEITGPEAIVDWLYIEIVNSAQTIPVSGKSVLLKRNGKIVEADGISPVSFRNIEPGQNSLLIYHRHHLTLKTSEEYLINPGPLSNIDLSNDLNKIKGSLNAVRQISGRYLMISGDADSNGLIQTTDLIRITEKLNSFGYHNEDTDMNGVVNEIDINLKTIPNIGKERQH